MGFVKPLSSVSPNRTADGIGTSEAVAYTEEMKRCRNLNQSEMDLCWKNLAERMEEEVLDKYKVEESKRGAFKGRGSPSE